MLAPVRTFQLLAEQEVRTFMRAKLCAAIMVVRRLGHFDTANQVSEWLHCWERGYEPYRLHGFPQPNDSGGLKQP